MNILHISAECYPIAKVGGLADVVGALPKYQNTLGVKSEVIMPYFNTVYTTDKPTEICYQSFLTLGENSYKFRILKFKDVNLGFNLYLVDIPELLFKNYVYSDNDTERFLAFHIAVLNWVLTWSKNPDIIHCHDHHTGLVPFLITQAFKYKSLANIPTLITIHNAQYQGWFSHNKINLLPSFDSKKTGLLDWNGCINPLAAAIKCAWKVTTVSKSYMKELQQNANGLENLLKHENAKCIGILNGIDSQVWNPDTDNYLIENFNTKTVDKKRIENKKWLCKTYNLDESKPLFAFIGRLVGEKGAELLPEVFEKALEKFNISILVLGSGINEVEKNLIALKKKYKGRYNAFIGYDEKLSHIIYGGTNFLVMPSRVEPCGLNQLYALRYGAIPIVREIGGLKDTIIDIRHSNGVGITHQNVTVQEIVEAMGRAVKLYENKQQFKKLIVANMKLDYSWKVSAKEYLNVYKELKK